MKEHDSIFEENGKWYFWDEIWSHCYGPYDTREICEQKLAKYCDDILGIHELIKTTEESIDICNCQEDSGD